MIPSKPNFDDEKLELIVLYFTVRLMQVFSFLAFKAHFKEVLDPFTNPDRKGEAYIQVIIEDACLCATLLAIRDLDDFFKSQSCRPDDLKAQSLGYNLGLNGASFLSKSEREEINKLIIHMTATGAFAKEERGWDISELTMKAYSQSHDFLNWVQTNYPPQHNERVWGATTYCANLIKEFFEYASIVSPERVLLRRNGGSD